MSVERCSFDQFDYTGVWVRILISAVGLVRRVTSQLRIR